MNTGDIISGRYRIERHVGRAAMTEHRGQPLHPLRALARRELRNRGRHEQERRSEDRRDHARRIQLQRQMRGLAFEKFVADLPLRILD